MSQYDILDDADNIIEKYKKYEGNMNFAQWQESNMPLERFQQYEAVKYEKIELENQLRVVEKEWREILKKVETLNDKISQVSKKVSKFILPNCCECDSPSFWRYCDNCE